MKNLYEAHCSTKTFTKDDLADLTQGDMKDLKKLAETEGLYVQENPLSHGGLLVSGLKAGVNQVEQMLHSITPLRREMRFKEEENLYPRVAWCILGRSGKWKRLPKTANYNLEKRNIAKGIVDAQGNMWSVNLLRMEATCHRLTKLKRLENLEDFTFPLYWDAMTPAEDLKQVLVDPSSAEYRTVLEAFRKTVTKTVVKIERLQNVHLRRVYELQKKHMSEKNKPEGGAGERLLYHGTSQDTYNSIKTKGFNRSFSGKNATVYGLGTYFAVNASSSAHRSYSMTANDGTQAMFVARVLTGVYTPGTSNMRVPPPRNVQQPDDRYDSLVDRMENPSLFVVFHDDQAYPDYLITFC
ncbi:protein mono-ADP-ribosyltransferase PARP15-like [Cololabis saira]|uniref:protein mono-ADP-ribosyltransferase PARP15-like n=1 Tax=Cololabis saira TaxID=129043 RepID=UPI002AD472B0|nr:protein mono-ADP-ribosyltransferase PARP15-like [Cololabis saira]